MNGTSRQTLQNATASTSRQLRGSELTCLTGCFQVEAGQRFAAVLLAATPRSSDGLDGKYVAQLAMAACHPVVTTARRARPVWADVSHRLSSIPAIIAGATA